MTPLLLEEGARTRLPMTALCSSPAARDRAAATPMAEGMEEGCVRLDTLLPGWG